MAKEVGYAHSFVLRKEHKRDGRAGEIVKGKRRRSVSQEFIYSHGPRMLSLRYYHQFVCLRRYINKDRHKEWAYGGVALFSVRRS